MKIISVNKKLIILLQLLLLVNFSLSQELVEVTIDPNLCYDCISCFKNIITVKNNFTDTMVTFKYFYYEGIEDSVNVQPMLSYFNPNLILFKPLDFSSIFVDGTIDVNFTYLPEFVILPPNSTRFFVLDNENILFNSQEKKYSKKVYLSIGYKYDLDTLMYYNYNSFFEEYNNKSVNKDSIYVNYSDSLYIFKENNKFYNNFNLIKNIFKFKFRSKSK